MDQASGEFHSPEAFYFLIREYRRTEQPVSLRRIARCALRSIQADPFGEVRVFSNRGHREEDPALIECFRTQ